MATKFTYASLFSGIGGFEQALNKFGGTCVFASEIDKFAAKAYETLYGHKPEGDITQIDAKDIPKHGLLTAGFPCVAFSVAGKRAGMNHICVGCGNEQVISFEEYVSGPKCNKCSGDLEPEDPRGVLFFEIARVALAKQPSALLLENVKGLVNHDKGNTLDTMIRTLNEIGYVVDFDVLNSKYFGVPQNRERIFIVAIRDDLIEAEPFSEESTTGQTIVPKGKRRIGDWAKTFNFVWPEQGEVTTRLRDILESEVGEKYYLDEEKTAKLVAQLEEKYTEVSGMVRGGTQKNAYEGDGNISPTLTEAMGAGGGHIPLIVESPQKYRIRKFTPLECWRLQDFPDEAHEAVKNAGISDSQRYKQAGNAVTVNVIEAIAERLIPLIADA